MARLMGAMPRPESNASASAGFAGHTKCAWDEVNDDRLTGDELQLLLRVRFVADRDVTDGKVSTRQMKALEVLHGLEPAQQKKALRGLIRKGRLRREPDGFVDVGFAKVCKSAAQRKKDRENWKKWQQASRSQKAPLSGPDTSPDSAPDSGASPSPSPSPSESSSSSRSPSDGQQLTPEGTTGKTPQMDDEDDRNWDDPPEGQSVGGGNRRNAATFDGAPYRRKPNEPVGVGEPPDVKPGGLPL